MINSSNVDAVEMVDDTLPLLPDGPSLETCEEVIEAGIPNLLRGRPSTGSHPGRTAISDRLCHVPVISQGTLGP